MRSGSNRDIQAIDDLKERTFGRGHPVIRKFVEAGRIALRKHLGNGSRTIHA